ncbi:hypothetical protein SAMN05216551_103146 [Chitinasiproducens palmae]|uniref:Uncharacterized protein n=1 Tax=Chitinasiproducens palmae TaxID=1770053 RepID=A0A1H2PM86_9BURK|nr:hypothetical protein SAMN05216551_103146 [Chitinasiproducens palmae]
MLIIETQSDLSNFFCSVLFEACLPSMRGSALRPRRLARGRALRPQWPSPITPVRQAQPCPEPWDRWRGTPDTTAATASSSTAASASASASTSAAHCSVGVM